MMTRHFLIKPEAMSRTLRRGGLFLLGGMALMGIAFVGAPLGILSGMMAMMYGACCGSFHRWDREKGLWMLAVAFLVLMGPVYLVCAWMELFGQREKTWLAIDMFLGTVMLGSTVNLLLSVMVYNRRVSQALNALIGKKAKAHSTDEPNGHAPRQPS
ncbi:MAG: hypothetical protein KJ072_15010 [Verrucomicrobia bacterium]|nr:hypothetical protein [Verrucomicrobiota bacterium]